MNIRIFDIEADGLLDEVTKIHCLSYFDFKTKSFESITDPVDIQNVMREEGVIWAGHNILSYDFPVLNKILGVAIPKFVIDTLLISYYLYPEVKKHGLAEWGERLGIKKPKIEDWKNLTVDQYIHRCEEDVKINVMLWNREKIFLDKIYQDDANLLRFLEYLYFKGDCCREQESEGLKLDVTKCQSLIESLKIEIEAKRNELEGVMPRVNKYKVKVLKDVAISSQGQITKKGDMFYEMAIADGAIHYETYKLKTLSGTEAPNVGSFIQIKAWLDSLGWVPQNIKHQRNKKTNEVKMIPQIKSKDKEGEICPSVKKLFEKEPKLAVLEGLFVLRHRLSVLEGFMKEQKNGILYPTLQGLTNTLRLKHKVVVNLPAIYKKYGKEIRGCIIAKEGHVLMGSDLANIEDRTKRHYIFKYDPEYVKTMNTPGYDAHLEIALLAEFMTQEEVDWYKWYEKELDLVSKKESQYQPTKEDKERYSRLKGLRNKSKVTNFSATYKVGAEALARNANIPLKEAKKLLKIYWERNKAILQIENDCLIREVGETRWLQNPISKFWYSLRSDKDKFSTLNQGSAVYMFDMWILEVRIQNTKVPFQYHDEILLNTPQDSIEKDREVIKFAMSELNRKVPLNVPIDCSIAIGDNYADTH